MNLEINSETVKLCEIISREKRTKVIEGDMIVPDIKPDILSISNIDYDIFITKKEIKDGKLYIEGLADVSAIYIAEDQNGSIKSLNNVFNFLEAFDIEGINDESIIRVNIEEDPIEYKVMNGRKLGVRIPITLDVSVRKNCEHTIAKDVIDNSNIEMRKEEIEIYSLTDSQRQNIELNEIVNISEEKPAISEILKASMKIENIDYKISYNKILAKADAIVRVIYVSDTENSAIETYEAVLPVMGFINSDNLNENSEIKLEFNIKSFTLRPIYQDLKSTSFSVDSEIEICANVYQKKKIEIISDLYDPDMELKYQTEKMLITNEIINASEEVELLQGLMIPELDNIRILSINANPIVNNKSVLDGKVAVEGNVEFTILYYNELKRVVETKKVELPYQQVLKIPEVKNDMPVQINVRVKEIDYRKADSTTLQIKAILEFNTLVNEERQIEGITQIELEENNNLKRPSIVVYYVKPGDTLWNIAKKYKSTVDELKEYNLLKDDMIYPNQQLIIPKRNRVVALEIM